MRSFGALALPSPAIAAVKRAIRRHVSYRADDVPAVDPADPATAHLAKLHAALLTGELDAWLVEVDAVSRSAVPASR